MQTAPNDIKGTQVPRWRLARAGVATGVTVVGAAVLTWVLLRVWTFAYSAIQAPGPASVEEMVLLVVSTAALAVGGWLALGTTLELLSYVPGRIGELAAIGARKCTPALARRVAAFMIGVGMGVVGGPTQALASRAPAHSSVSADNPVSAANPGAGDNPGSTSQSQAVAPAHPGFVPTATQRESDATGTTATAPHPGFVPTTPKTTTSESVDVKAPGPQVSAPAPGFTPTKPRVRAQVDPGLLGARSAPATPGEVVVHRGDSLWSLAAAHLGPDASEAEIAAEWPRWYATNRDTIGPDPNLIHPGQILHVPPPSSEQP